MSRISIRISDLENIILFLVSGYTCIYTFFLVALKERNHEINHILVSSLVVGYIIVTVMNLIPFTITYQVDCVGIIATSILIGFITGKVCIHDKFSKIIDIFKLHTTQNKYIWDDLLDVKYPMYAEIQMKDNTAYNGYIRLFEENARQPQVILAGYIHIDGNGEILENHQRSENQIILLDTKEVKSVTIKYYSKSDRCDKIRRIIKNHDAPGSPTYHLHHPEE